MTAAETIALEGRGRLLPTPADAPARVTFGDASFTLAVGAATIANDVVFTETYDGTIYAYNAKTGAKVWSVKAPNVASWLVSTSVLATTTEVVRTSGDVRSGDAGS